MDIAAEYRPLPRFGRPGILGAALVLLAGVVLVVVTQLHRSRPGQAPADGAGSIPGSNVFPTRGIDPDGVTAPSARTGLPTTARGSVNLDRLSLTARIVFMSGIGNGDIYEMNDDGSDPHARFSDPGHDCGPAYSPDGRYLMFSSQRSSGISSSSSAGLDVPGALPWYPLNFDLYLLEMATGTLRQLTVNTGVDFTPTWSPDGRRIAFGSGPLGRLTSIWLMNADGTGLRQLTQSHGSTFHWLPDWSPDGTRIAYTSSDLADLAHPSLHVVDADGSNDRVLVEDGGFPAWSPDGRVIAFASSRGRLPGHYDLYLMDPDGSHQRLLHHQEGAELAPTWSPDGHHIAYVQDRDGLIFGGSVLLPEGIFFDVRLGGPETSSIWRVDADGTNPVQLTAPTGDIWPAYAPDGKT